MRLLVLSPWPPLPENSGMRQLTMNLLRYLAPRHVIDVVGFFSRDEERSSGWDALARELPLRVLATFPERRGAELNATRSRLLAQLLPASLARWQSSAATAFLGSLDLGVYDAVLLDTIYMATYGRTVGTRPNVLLAPDALSMGTSPRPDTDMVSVTAAAALPRDSCSSVSREPGTRDSIRYFSCPAAIERGRSASRPAPGSGWSRSRSPDRSSPAAP